MKTIEKSNKLADVCYDIRGPVLKQAVRLEEEGYRILKLNIGNPAPFGFDAPDEIIQDIIANLREAQGYVDSKGLFAARKAIMHETQRLQIPGVNTDDIYLGNGASELIVMAMQALLNQGDEVLIPSPDYPLWTAAVNVSGGKSIHYHCDEKADWFPDIEDIKLKITKNTRGIVIINPNNPTGAVYSEDLLKQIVDLAREHNLILFADEIYSKIVYDGMKHIPLSRLSEDVICLSFNGLSKSYRLAGFRSGWMFITGDKRCAKSYIEGLDILASMRLCANAPAMLGVQTALGGYQSINELILPGGRLKEQRDLAYDLITAIPGISCVKPKGALYLFPKVDINKFNISNDEKWVLEFLTEKKVLVVQGTAFNWEKPDHFRIVFLPHKDELRKAIGGLEEFFAEYKQS
ncbi:MAG: alanine-synthesizing transaminase [Cellvibrionaceae bacterium]|jgi:alanine-synthesizing transaminase